MFDHCFFLLAALGVIKFIQLMNKTNEAKFILKATNDQQTSENN